jgi:hypothetical protein
MLLWRCRTAEQLHHHGLNTSNVYALCAQEPEHIDHLIVKCVYAWETWRGVLHRCGWQLLMPNPQDNFTYWWLHSRKKVTKPCHRAFDSMVVCVVWNIWPHKNAHVFHQTISSAPVLVDAIWVVLDLWGSIGLVVRSLLELE